MHSLRHSVCKWSSRHSSIMQVDIRCNVVVVPVATTSMRVRGIRANSRENLDYSRMLRLHKQTPHLRTKSGGMSDWPASTTTQHCGYNRSGTVTIPAPCTPTSTSHSLTATSASSKSRAPKSTALIKYCSPSDCSKLDKKAGSCFSRLRVPVRRDHTTRHFTLDCHGGMLNCARAHAAKPTTTSLTQWWSWPRPFSGPPAAGSKEKPLVEASIIRATHRPDGVAVRCLSFRCTTSLKLCCQNFLSNLIAREPSLPRTWVE